MIPDPQDAGFVYIITNLTDNRKYIGRKYLWSVSRKKVAGKKRRRVVRAESDWRSYKSSCQELKDDIVSLGLSSFKFEIIACYKTRGEVNYNEVRIQFLYDVLNRRLPDGTFEFYNTNILNRYFRKNMLTSNGYEETTLESA